MSKKKIISLCLVVCLLATAIGGTLAYFTDTDSEKNTFTVGKVDIEVSETNKINNVDVTGNAFENVMPGTEITKTAVVTNNSSETAYVRVMVRVNNQQGLYEMLTKNGGDELAVDMAKVMPGWNFTPLKTNGMRYVWTPDSATGVTVLGVDEAMKNYKGGTYLASGDNYITNDAEQASKGEDGRITLKDATFSNGQYVNAINWDDLVWIFYLKMEPNATYTLFKGINVPANFDSADDMAFFKDLEINVCADAIQSTGFTDAKVAFAELEKAHSLADWGFGPTP